MPNVAIVLPGEAMWGAFQTGFAFELGARLQEAGAGENPFQVAIGSSSGSLIAAAAAGGGRFDHDLAKNSWIEFGRATRFRMRRPFNPYPEALQKIFEGGLVNVARAFQSPTELIVTASDYHGQAAGDLRRDHLRLFQAGLRLFWTGVSARDSQNIAEIGASLLDDGVRLFGTRYYSTKAAPESAMAPSLDEVWHQVASVGELRKAIEASSRVPLLYGNPILDGANVLIDGVFTNNAPLELALQYGARHVFVVTSSKKGYVFDRPVQTMVRRELRALMKSFERAGRRLSFLPRRLHISDSLKELARLAENVPEPKPLDLDALRRRYPGQEIHVIHPKKGATVNRFFESDPRVLGGLYDMGRELASDLPVID